MSTMQTDAGAVLLRADELRRGLGEGFRDRMVTSLYAEAQQIAGRAVHAGEGRRKWDWDQRIDRIVTSPIFGLPIMLLMLAVIFWITIVGANVPSQMLASSGLKAGRRRSLTPGGRPGG
jgi:ferrous iron transport protein B